MTEQKGRKGKGGAKEKLVRGSNSSSHSSSSSRKKGGTSKRKLTNTNQAQSKRQAKIQAQFKSTLYKKRVFQETFVSHYMTKVGLYQKYLYGGGDTKVGKVARYAFKATDVVSGIPVAGQVIKPIAMLFKTVVSKLSHRKRHHYHKRTVQHLLQGRHAADYLETVLWEVGFELARIYEFQISVMHDERNVIKLADEAATLSVDYFKRQSNENKSIEGQLRNYLLLSVFCGRSKHHEGDEKANLKTVDPERYPKWRLPSALHSPGLRAEFSGLKNPIVEYYHLKDTNYEENKRPKYGYRDTIYFVKEQKVKEGKERTKVKMFTPYDISAIKGLKKAKGLDKDKTTMDYYPEGGNAPEKVNPEGYRRGTRIVGCGEVENYMNYVRETLKKGELPSSFNLFVGNKLGFPVVAICHESLRGMDLRGGDFTESVFNYVDFTNAKLQGACFDDALMFGADLTDVEVDNTTFKGAQLSMAVLHASPSSTSRQDSSSSSTKPEYSIDLSGAILRYTDLSGMDFSKGRFVNTDMRFSIVEMTRLPDEVFERVPALLREKCAFENAKFSKKVTGKDIIKAQVETQKALIKVFNDRFKEIRTSINELKRAIVPTDPNIQAYFSGLTVLIQKDLKNQSEEIGALVEKHGGLKGLNELLSENKALSKKLATINQLLEGLDKKIDKRFDDTDKKLDNIHDDLKQVKELINHPPNSPVKETSVSQLVRALKLNYSGEGKGVLVGLFGYEQKITDCYVDLMLVKQEDYNKRVSSAFNKEDKKQHAAEKKNPVENHERIKRLKRYEDRYEIERPISPEALFRSEQPKVKQPKSRSESSVQPASSSKQVNSVLITGRAGIGKSVFCQKLAYAWSQADKVSHPTPLDAWLKGYEMVFWVALRDISADEALNIDKHKKGLFDVLHQLTILNLDRKTIDVEAIEKTLSGNKVLLILDGYDEVAHLTQDSLIKNVLDDAFALPQRNSKLHLILTTRGYAQPMHRFDRTVENMGFNREHIQEYIVKYGAYKQAQQKKEGERILKKEGVRTVAKLIEHNPNLLGLAHVPIQLQLMCEVFFDEHTLNQKVSSQLTSFTITALYDKMIVKLLRYYLIKHDDQKGTLTSGHVYAGCDEELRFLEALAYEGMQTGRIYLSHESVSKSVEHWERSQNARRVKKPLSKGLDMFLKHTAPIKDKTGRLQVPHKNIPIDCIHATQLLRGVGDVKDSGIMKSYYFMHLTIQEFLTARYVVRQLNSASSTEVEQVKAFILENKYISRYEWVLQFTAGLLYQASKQANSVSSPQSASLSKATRTFWEVLMNQSPDLIGVRGLHIGMLCLKEASDGRRLDERLKEYSRNIICELASVIDCTQGDVSKKSRFEVEILLEEKRSMIKALHLNTFQFTESDWSTSLEQIIVKNIGHQHYEIKVFGLWVLKTLKVYSNENKVPDKLVKLVISALKDGYSWRVRLAAAKALGKLKVSDKQVIDALLTALKNTSGGVNSQRVPQAAANAFAQLKIADQVIIAALLHVLKDDDYYHLRSTAAHVLAELGQMDAARDTIIAGLLTALKDKNSSVTVREAAANALIKLGQMDAARGAIITGLLAALKDKNSSVVVREAAANALIKLGQMDAARGAIITGLLAALKDKNSSVTVREAAANALNKLRQMDAARGAIITGLPRALAARSANISVLLMVLKNRRWQVHFRRAAVYALIKLGQIEAARCAIITGLLTALKDDDEDVRLAAANALIKLGQTDTARYAIIAALLTALKVINNAYIREAAAHALGRLKVTDQVVIFALFTALKDNDEDVRQAARSALQSVPLEQVIKDFFSSPQEVYPRVASHLAKLSSVLHHAVTFVTEKINTLTSVMRYGLRVIQSAQIVACKWSETTDEVKITLIKAGDESSFATVKKPKAFHELLECLIKSFNDCNVTGQRLSEEQLKQQFAPFLIDKRSVSLGGKGDKSKLSESEEEGVSSNALSNGP